MDILVCVYIWGVISMVSVRFVRNGDGRKVLRHECASIIEAKVDQRDVGMTQRTVLLQRNCDVPRPALVSLMQTETWRHHPRELV